MDLAAQKGFLLGMSKDRENEQEKKKSYSHEISHSMIVLCADHVGRSIYVYG
jgi:hypothetical protein